MDEDGHSGLSNDVVNEASSDNFQAKLSYLKKDSGNFFVIHVSSLKIYTGSNYQPANLLQELGFKKYENCPLNPSGCYYREIYLVRNDFNKNDMEHTSEVQYVHSEFNNFMREIDSIFKSIIEIKRKSRLFFKDYTFVKPISLKEIEIKTPIWIEQYKSEKFKEGFEKIERIKKELKDEISLLKLLTSNDDELVNSVKLAFEKIGFDVIKTQKGFTVDLLAKSPTLNMGLEVTGTVNVIDKKTKKINQILAFQQEDEFNGYKSVVIANVRMDKNPKSRKEPFITNEALSLLKSLNSIFLDTYTLFKIVKEVEQENYNKIDLINKLKDGIGIFEF